VTLQTERLLDPIGWRILEALQADARLSFSQLGRRVGLSAPAAAERVRRMEDAGIIAGYRVDLALEKLFPVTAIIRISASVSIVEGLKCAFQSLSGTRNSLALAGSDITFLRSGGVGYGMPRARGSAGCGVVRALRIDVWGRESSRTPYIGPRHARYQMYRELTGTTSSTMLVPMMSAKS